MDHASLVVQDLVKQILWLAWLLAVRAALDDPDNIVRLSFAHKVPQAMLVP